MDYFIQVSLLLGFILIWLLKRTCRQTFRTTHLQMMITAETAVGVAEELQMILSGAPAEDQTADNVGIVANVLATLASGTQITGEVSDLFDKSLQKLHYFIIYFTSKLLTTHQSLLYIWAEYVCGAKTRAWV